MQAHPNADGESVEAVHQAIVDWDFALRQEFGGLITLTDVTDRYTATHKADIIIHYNPTAGGNVFGGYAVCGATKCVNVIVRSELIAPIDFTYPPQYLYYVTMHEHGHALGLGHALPLEESTDLMGYGWHWSNGIVLTLSECDLDGIAYVFAWALEGVDPSSDRGDDRLRLGTSREGQPLGCPSDRRDKVELCTRRPSASVAAFRPSSRATTEHRSSGNHAPAAMASRALIRSGRRWGAGLRRHGVLHRLGDRLNHGGRVLHRLGDRLDHRRCGERQDPSGEPHRPQARAHRPLGRCCEVHAAPGAQPQRSLHGLSLDSAPLGPPADDAMDLPFRRYDLDASSLGHAVANTFHCPLGDAALG